MCIWKRQVTGVGADSRHRPASVTCLIEIILQEVRANDPRCGYSAVFEQAKDCTGAATNVEDAQRLERNWPPALDHAEGHGHPLDQDLTVSWVSASPTPTMSSTRVIRLVGGTYSPQLGRLGNVLFGVLP
jgi:hypothetical protein